MAKAMKEGLIARKRGMTQVFGDDGNLTPVTVLEAGPCTVVQIKSRATDGYDALQLGFEAKRKKVLKPMAGHFKKAGVPATRVVTAAYVSTPSVTWTLTSQISARPRSGSTGSAR